MKNFKDLVESNMAVETIVEAAGRVPRENDMILFIDDYMGFEKGDHAKIIAVSSEDADQTRQASYLLTVSSMHDDTEKDITIPIDAFDKKIEFVYKTS